MRIHIGDYYNRKGEKAPIWAAGVAGAVARTWAASIIAPVELVRTKMQAKSTTYKSKFNILNVI